jgi:hypothetical protein
MYNEILSQLNEGIKALIDALAALGAGIGLMWLLQITSSIISVLAALASLVWYSIRIYDRWKERKPHGNKRFD